MTRREPDRPIASAPETPLILVVVPVYDEVALIEAKVSNLAALTYPASHRRIVIVDGGSSDGSIEEISRLISDKCGFSLLETVRRSKTAQVNDALEREHDVDWVLITDADALLPLDAIEQLLEVAEHPGVGVVGARVVPVGAHSLERLHWRIANWIREWEFRRGSAAIVTAPCYLTKPFFVKDMPEDTVADDVHVACRAMVAGCRVGIQSSCVVMELRSPRNLWQFLSHKFRKADAYLREVFRFLPYVREVAHPMKGVFLRHAAALIAMPAAVIVAIGAVLAASIDTFNDLERPLWVFPVIMAILCSGRGRQAARFVALIGMLAVSAVAALLVYPCSRQTASFHKVSRSAAYALPKAAGNDQS